jgi:hypothetical protein
MFVYVLRIVWWGNGGIVTNEKSKKIDIYPKILYNRL